MDKKVDGFEVDILHFFENDCKLDLQVYSSCQSNEVAFDEGEGKGSIWTNTFIAKNDFGEEMKVATLRVNTKSQTANYYNILVVPMAQ